MVTDLRHVHTRPQATPDTIRTRHRHRRRMVNPQRTPDHSRRIPRTPQLRTNQPTHPDPSRPNIMSGSRTNLYLMNESIFPIPRHMRHSHTNQSFASPLLLHNKDTHHEKRITPRLTARSPNTLPSTLPGLANPSTPRCLGRSILQSLRLHRRRMNTTLPVAWSSPRRQTKTLRPDIQK